MNDRTNVRLIVFSCIALSIIAGLVLIDSIPDAATRRAKQHFEQAKDAFRKRQWQQAMVELDQSGKSPESEILRDSVQFFIDRDSIYSTLRKLKIVLDGPPEQRDQLISILAINSRYLTQLSTYSPNGKPVADLLEHLGQISSRSNSYADSIKSIQAEISDIEENTKDVKFMYFAIQRQFDMSGAKGVYDALNLTLYGRVVVIAAFDEIPNSPVSRMRVPLAVREVGERLYTLTNAFGGVSTEYFLTFETVDGMREISAKYVALKSSLKSIMARQENDSSLFAEDARITMIKLEPELKTLFDANNF